MHRDERPGRIQNPRQVLPAVSPGKGTGVGEGYGDGVSHILLYYFDVILFFAAT